MTFHVVLPCKIFARIEESVLGMYLEELIGILYSEKLHISNPDH
jgi:hypothetical protein